MKQKISLKQLRAIVREYHRFLPEWQYDGKETLYRMEGPVVQAIDWHVLSWGDYRPMHHVSVLAAPEREGRSGATLLFNMPTSPASVSLPGHAETCQRMFETMQREFFPAITAPLNAEAVLRLAEEKCIPTRHEACGLAALNAYFGHQVRALYWSKKFTELVKKRPERFRWNESEVAQRQFLDRLEQWMTLGVAKEKLDGLVQEQQQKWHQN